MTVTARPHHGGVILHVTLSLRHASPTVDKILNSSSNSTALRSPFFGIIQRKWFIEFPQSQARASEVIPARVLHGTRRGALPSCRQRLCKMVLWAATLFNDHTNVILRFKPTQLSSRNHLMYQTFTSLEFARDCLSQDFSSPLLTSVQRQLSIPTY